MNDNPQAFPQIIPITTSYVQETVISGMTLRDYFAGQALMAIAGKSYPDGIEYKVAVESYSYADYMLKVRKET